METVRRKKSNKINSVYRSYQAQLMGLMYLIILHRSSIRRLMPTTQDEGHS